MRIHRHRIRKSPLNVPQYKVNQKIKVPEVRLFDAEGKDMGVVPTEEAIKLAEAKEMDLVEVDISESAWLFYPIGSAINRFPKPPRSAGGIASCRVKKMHVAEIIYIGVH